MDFLIESKNYKASHDVEENSTFMVQTLFFALVLIENILLVRKLNQCFCWFLCLDPD